MKNTYCKLAEKEIHALPERFKGFLLSPFQFNQRGGMVGVPEDTFTEMIEIIAEYAQRATPAATAAPERCPYCDGTGDVHSPTGEWRGACDCSATAAPGDLELHNRIALRLDWLAKGEEICTKEFVSDVTKLLASNAATAAPSSPIQRQAYKDAQAGLNRAASKMLENLAVTAAPGDLLRKAASLIGAQFENSVTPPEVAEVINGLSVLASNAGAAPGWQTVPKILTREMSIAGKNAWACTFGIDMDAIYTAILAAAPSNNSPVGAQGEAK